MNTFKERLAAAANEAGIDYSQTAIAKSLGLKKQTVDYWMTHDGEPRMGVLFLIADKWGVDARWLATGDGVMLPPPGGPGLRSEELELVKGYRKASTPHRASLRVMAKSLGKAIAVLALCYPLFQPDRADAATLHNYVLRASEIHIFAKLLSLFTNFFRLEAAI